MNTKKRTVRAGLAAFTLTAALVTVAGPATADIPLQTPASAGASDIAGSSGSGSLASGSVQKENGTDSGAASAGGSSGSSTGSSDAIASAILDAVDYVPCSGLHSGHQNSALAEMVMMLVSAATGTWYGGQSCPS